MREIKFRAWNKRTEKMIDLHAITPLAVDPQVTITNDGLYLPFSDGYILMQYTGLKDSGGVDIYEGDIVKNKTDTGTVFWHDIRAMFLVDNSATDIAPMDDWDLFEVIGNIWEHSHLLDKGNH